MGHRAAETTCSINSALGPGIVINHTVQLWFKKFCKGHESFEDEEPSGWPSEVGKDQLRASSELIKKLLKNSAMTFYGHLAFEANWKGEKA